MAGGTDACVVPGRGRAEGGPDLRDAAVRPAIHGTSGGSADVLSELAVIITLGAAVGALMQGARRGAHQAR